MIFFSGDDGLKIDPLVPWALEASSSSEQFVRLPRGLTLEQVERLYIQATLQEKDGRVAEAADQLGVTRKVLWSRRRKLGLLGDDGR